MEARLVDVRSFRGGKSASSYVIKFKSFGFLAEMDKYPEISCKAVGIGCCAMQCCVHTWKRKLYDLTETRLILTLGWLPDPKHQTQKGNGNRSVQNMGKIPKDRRKI